MNNLKITLIPLSALLLGASLTQAATADDVAQVFAQPDAAAQELTVLNQREMQQTQGAYGRYSIASINWAHEDLVARPNIYGGFTIQLPSINSGSGSTYSGSSGTPGYAPASSRGSYGNSRSTVSRPYDRPKLHIIRNPWPIFPGIRV